MPTTRCSALICGTDIQLIRFVGPISDILTRTAYVAAYDRQKRHPAWVCHDEAQ